MAKKTTDRTSFHTMADGKPSKKVAVGKLTTEIHLMGLPALKKKLKELETRIHHLEMRQYR